MTPSYSNPSPRITFIAGAALAMSLAVSEAQSIRFEKLWEIAPATRSYVPNTGNTERGLAYNPVNGHLYVPSRASGNKVFILDAATGEEVPNPDNGDLPELKMAGISGGTFAINLMGVGDDGTVYIANLSTSTTAPSFKLYKWDSEASDPVVVFSGNPREGTAFRWGDAMDVRGGGGDTRIVISAGGTGATASRAVAVFVYTDETLSSLAPISFEPAGVNAADLRLGITFGPGETLFGKTSGTTATRYIGYDLNAPSALSLATATLEAGISTLKYEPVTQLLYGLNPAAGNHRLVAYEASSPTTPNLVTSFTFPAGGANNVNLSGGIAVSSNRLFALDTHNGILAYSVNVDTNPTPPTVSSDPVGIAVLEGGSGQLTAAASGTRPLDLQWLKDGQAIDDATNLVLRLAEVSQASAGSYVLRVRNEGGEALSRPALVTINPSVRTAALDPVWKLAPGQRPYLTTDNTQRGLAYNPLTGNLLLMSRTPTNAIHVLDAATGAERHTLDVDPSVITQGTFTLNLLAVADDGAVYACNLTTDGASASQRFKVYRWPADDGASPPELVYNGDPNNGAGSQRWGDSFDVRGSGLDTQILAGSRNGTVFAVLSMADGVTFSSTPFPTTASAGSFGLSVAFGEGDTVWGKQAGGGVTHASFDITAVASEVLRVIPLSQIPGSVAGIAVDSANGYLAAISIESSDNLRLYSLPRGEEPAVWRDTEFFVTDNDNLNFTGAADFGGGWLYALDTNNGLLALRVAPQLILSEEAPGSLLLKWTGVYKLQSASSLQAPIEWSDVVGAVASPHPVVPASSGSLFYRLVNN